MNKVWITGNIVADAELKTVNAGGVPTPRCTFSVAVNEQKKNGEKIVNYFKVTLWREQTTIAPWLMRGRKVGVEGSIRLHNYTTANNEKRYELEIANPSVEMLDKKPSAVPAPVAETQAEPEELPF